MVLVRANQDGQMVFVFVFVFVLANVFVFVFVFVYVFVDCGVDEGRPKVGSGRG